MGQLKCEIVDQQSLYQRTEESKMEFQKKYNDQMGFVNKLLKQNEDLRKERDKMKIDLVKLNKLQSEAEMLMSWNCLQNQIFKQNHLENDELVPSDERTYKATTIRTQ